MIAWLSKNKATSCELNSSTLKGIIPHLADASLGPYTLTFSHSFMRRMAYSVNILSCALTSSMPMPFRYFIAAIRPTPPQMLGVPASNFQGRSFQEIEQRLVIVLKETSFIIAPPPWNGSISSRISCLPYKTPMPVGPSILCPEKARKSISKSLTSTGRWGTD